MSLGEALSWVYLVFVLVWFYSISSFLKLIKKKCVDAYKDMGEPTLIKNMGMGTQIKLLKFIFSSHPEITDVIVNRQMLKMRYLFFFGLLLFVLWAVFAA